MKTFLTAIILVYISIGLSAQDTIRIMQYNLLMYGDNFGGCTSSNNNVYDKNEYLKTIVNYVEPDIVFVNELYKDIYYHDLILDNVFNIDGVNYFKRANASNLANSYTVNQAFYNSQKFQLMENFGIETDVRDIDIFKFACLTAGNSGDNPIIHCAVAHLKAGSYPENEQSRTFETNKLMTYLNNSGADGNYTFSGDFNVYSASEQAFQNLMNYANPTIRFYDPINKINWSSSSYYADVHTQSTHTAGNCFSGGGLDDRFDFILVSNEILDGSQSVKYVNGSYRAVGQDGQHFNNSLISSPQNSSVPPDVLNALYNMSDHLPVIADLAIGENVGSVQDDYAGITLFFPNPAKGDFRLHFDLEEPAGFNLEIDNSFGQKVYREQIVNLKAGDIEIPAGSFEPGLYFISTSTKSGSSLTRKLVVL